jgi:hypothetical protein
MQVLEALTGFEWNLRIAERSLIVEVPEKSIADQLLDTYTSDLATAAVRFGREDIRLRWSRRRGGEHRIPATWAACYKFDNFSTGQTTMTQSISPDDNYVWFGGTVVYTESLEYHLNQMRETTTPMGLILPGDRTIQVGLNPASIRLFGLSRIEQGVRRDTTDDWFEPDLEIKRQKIRDSGDEPIEILARIKIGTQGWRLMRNTYQFIENRTLLIAQGQTESEVVATPELLLVA